MNNKKASCLLARNPNSHKGHYGRIGIVAGSLSMLGAGILTARAALRTGSGLVYLITVDQAVPLVNILYPEIIILPIKTPDGFFLKQNYAEVYQLIKDKQITSLVLGPGLGQEENTKQFVNNLLMILHKEKAPLSTVIDADGLNALSLEDLSKTLHPQCLLTPHPKEFARLFNIKASINTNDIKAYDKFRLKAMQSAATFTNALLLLKGHHTVISYQQQIALNNTGNPSMATAGSGDVLSGIIASLLGQGLGIFDSAYLGAQIHGLAGDYAHKKQHIGLIASDIIDHIPQSFKKLC
jgi:NAD(P)H-hydrate epimerase